MKNEQEDKLEQRIRFVAKHYREGALDEKRSWKAFAEAKGVKRSAVFTRYLRAAAAVFLVCLGTTILYIMENEKANWVLASTERGQTKKVFLPDSSLIVMAGGSVVKYDLNAFKKGNRVVEMEGKAFFQVTRDEDSPFSVSTTNTVVKVLGTAFQLEEKEGQTELYVSSGKVAFVAKEGNESEGLVLTEGMSAIYKHDEAEMMKTEEDHTNVLSWQTKQLHFNNTPLEQVIRDLSDYYQVVIVNRLAHEDKRLTASFSNLSLDEVLLVVNQTLDVHLVAEPIN